MYRINKLEFRQHSPKVILDTTVLWFILAHEQNRLDFPYFCQLHACRAAANDDFIHRNGCHLKYDARDEKDVFSWMDHRDQQN